MSSGIDNFLGRLESVRGKGPRWRARCPAHQSKGLTLSILEADDGRVLVKCFAGCGREEVVRAVGLEFSDLMPPSRIADHVPRVRKPWSPGEVARALEHEMTVLWLLLGDVARDSRVDARLRERLLLGRARCLALIEELAHG